ncbi:MAG TPA: FAD-dependent oxidoreductase [Caldilineae bacterium]|nr:FAD-dependent oxidoreductase [Caldilineae bacterium]
MASNPTRLPEPHRGRSIRLTLDGREVTAYEGETVAAVLLAEGQRTFRRTAHGDEPRSLFCGMGVCFDCLVTVDSRPHVRACLTPVREGMRVEVGGQRSVGAYPGGRPNGGANHDLPLPNMPPVLETEVAVVGAGPAGLEAALAAAEAGARVALVDGNALPGGQYFKQPPADFSTGTPDPHLREAAPLFARLQACQTLTHLADTQVWGTFADEDGGWLLTLYGCSAPHRLKAHIVILATGAYDRPIAFPGWTLPGVLTAGAVQTLLKTQGIRPGHRFLLTGSGPLQLVVAAQLVDAGAEVVAVLEGAQVSALLRPGHTLAAWGQWSRLGEGWAAWRTLRKAGVPIHFGRAVAAARGVDELEAVDIVSLDEDWRPISGSTETVAVDTLVLGYGFLPATQLSRLMGCEHEFAPRRGGWVPVRDDTMQTTLDGVYAVGDGAGIGGVALARLEGRVAGWVAANRVGRSDDQALRAHIESVRPVLERERRFADLLGKLFTPGPSLYALADDATLICRCEEVRLRDVRKAQASGCTTLNEIKGLTRVGMGNCQGRICGDLLARVLVDADLPEKEYEQRLAALGLLSVRPPITPLTVEELAQR